MGVAVVKQRTGKNQNIIKFIATNRERKKYKKELDWKREKNEKDRIEGNIDR